MITTTGIDFRCALDEQTLENLNTILTQFCRDRSMRIPDFLRRAYATILESPTITSQQTEYTDNTMVLIDIATHCGTKSQWFTQILLGSWESPRQDTLHRILSGFSYNPEQITKFFWAADQRQLRTDPSALGYAKRATLPTLLTQSLREVKARQNQQSQAKTPPSPNCGHSVNHRSSRQSDGPVAGRRATSRKIKTSTLTKQVGPIRVPVDRLPITGQRVYIARQQLVRYYLGQLISGWATSERDQKIQQLSSQTRSLSPSQVEDFLNVSIKTKVVVLEQILAVMLNGWLCPEQTDQLRQQLQQIQRLASPQYAVAMATQPLA